MAGDAAEEMIIELDFEKESKFGRREEENRL